MEKPSSLGLEEKDLILSPHEGDRAGCLRYMSRKRRERGWEERSQEPREAEHGAGDSQGQQSREDTLTTYEESLVSSFMLSPTNQSLLFSEPKVFTASDTTENKFQM